MWLYQTLLDIFETSIFIGCYEFFSLSSIQNYEEAFYMLILKCEGTNVFLKIPSMQKKKKKLVSAWTKNLWGWGGGMEAPPPPSLQGWIGSDGHPPWSPEPRIKQLLNILSFKKKKKIPSMHTCRI